MKEFVKRLDYNFVVYRWNITPRNSVRTAIEWAYGIYYEPIPEITCV